MNTTQLIALLKNYEFGGATGRPREISFTFGNIFIPSPNITVDSTGDGLITDMCLTLHEGDYPVDPQPDPVTGLMPCRGCGGKAEEQTIGAGFWRRIRCPKCRVRTDYEPAYSSKITWNRLMGWEE